MSQAIRVQLYGCFAVAGILLSLSPFRIGMVCGDSMAPSMKNGQIYLIDRAHYRKHPLKRGDVIVFDHDGETYLKRVVAAPGDSIYLLRQHDLHDDDLVMDWQVKHLRELSYASTFRNSVRLVTQRVPDGFCYVVGDHMSQSMDSRAFGLVPLDRVRGRVVSAPPPRPVMRHVAGVYADGERS